MELSQFSNMSLYVAIKDEKLEIMMYYVLPSLRQDEARSARMCSALLLQLTATTKRAGTLFTDGDPCLGNADHHRSTP